MKKKIFAALAASVMLCGMLTAPAAADTAENTLSLEDTCTILKQYIAEQKNSGNAVFHLANVYSQGDLTDEEGSIPDAFKDKVVVEYYYSDKEEFLNTVKDFMMSKNINEDLVFFTELQDAEATVIIDLKAIEQKLADFVKEKGYDATVTASEEDVAISFKQQAEGETEYDAAAITQEIRAFCENNSLDFSAVKVIFQASGTGIADVAGDANCDGLCDVADAVLIARFAAEDREATMTDQGRKNADVTHDGNVDGQDAKKILQYIAKKITLEDLAK